MNESSIPPFESFLETAVQRKGSLKAAKANLPAIKTPAQLKKVSDAEYLSQMMRRVFRAGLKHSLVDAKWPYFEKVFFAFDPQKMLLLDDAFFNRCMQDTGLIRHPGKLKAISRNAQMVCDKAAEHGSFGNYVANYDVQSIVEMWIEMKKQGAQMGGSSGPSFLRMVGKDTFLLTTDVVTALKSKGLVEKMPTSQRDMRWVQAVFNHWHNETGMPMSALSRIMSRAVN